MLRQKGVKQTGITQGPYVCLFNIFDNFFWHAFSVLLLCILWRDNVDAYMKFCHVLIEKMTQKSVLLIFLSLMWADVSISWVCVVLVPISNQNLAQRHCSFKLGSSALNMHNHEHLLLGNVKDCGWQNSWDGPRRYRHQNESSPFPRILFP
jgi:hypothetical protein